MFKNIKVVQSVVILFVLSVISVSTMFFFSLLFGANNLNNFERTLFTVVFAVSIILLLLVSLVIISTIRRSINNLISELEELAKGDFTVKIDTSSKNEFGKMRIALQKVISDISTIVNSIKEKSSDISEQSEALSAVSEQMTASSQEVANAIQDIARGADSQAQDLVTIRDNSNSFSKQLENIVTSIVDVDENAKVIDTMAKQSNEDLQKLSNSVSTINTAFGGVKERITGLGTSITQVSEITELINGVAAQTNLLALNAAIEAARAGETGRGFAVVAEEIRKLADQSKASSDNISKLIKDISDQTSVTVEMTDNVNKEFGSQIDIINSSISSFREIILALSTIMPKIENINQSATVINKEKESIVSKVQSASQIAEQTSATTEEISATSQQMSASTEEVASTAQNLDEMVKFMLEKINQFKVS